MARIELPPPSPAWASTSTGRCTAPRWPSAWASSPRPSTATPSCRCASARRPAGRSPSSTTASSARTPAPRTPSLHQVDEGFYAEVADWAHHRALTDREQLAAEFAQLFALDHQAMDDEFWARLRAAFADDELADLIICCGMFLGLGRAMAVVGVEAPHERIIV